MTQHFAGAERAADRRRRMLVSSSDTESSPVKGAKNQVSSAGLVEETRSQGSYIRFDRVEGAPASPLFPVSSIIPRSIWVYWISGFILILLFSAIGWVGQSAALLEPIVGTELITLFSAGNSSVVRFIGSLALMLSAQLALIVGWARSQSARDYAGRYHLWWKVACAASVLAFVHQFELHRIFAHRVLELVDRQVWRGETILWLIPAAIVGAALGGALRRELRHSVAARSLLTLTITGYLAAGGLTLECETWVAPIVPESLYSWMSETIAEMRSVLIQFLGSTAQWATALCFWLQARYVLYFNADPADPIVTPPSPKQSFLSRWRNRNRKANPESEADSHSGDSATSIGGPTTTASTSDVLDTDQVTAPEPTDRSSGRKKGRVIPRMLKRLQGANRVVEESRESGNNPQPGPTQSENTTDNSPPPTVVSATPKGKSVPREVPAASGRIDFELPSHIEELPGRSAPLADLEPVISELDEIANKSPNQSPIQPAKTERQSTSQAGSTSNIDSGSSFDMDPSTDRDIGSDFDEVADNDQLQLKGLSKRERRRLKQLKRDQQRSQSSE